MKCGATIKTITWGVVVCDLEGGHDGPHLSNSTGISWWNEKTRTPRDRLIEAITAATGDTGKSVDILEALNEYLDSRYRRQD